MSLSFTLRSTPAKPKPEAERRRILVTGAGGNIGTYFVENAGDQYVLRLMIHHPDKHQELGKYGEIVQGEVTDLPRLKELFRGIDTVVHLAGDPSPSATWDDLLPANIIGTYNVFVAAKAAGCRRVIYASSIHAVSGYPADVQVKTSEAVNPGDLYGVTKCFGEAMGRYIAEEEGLSVICLRIGAFQPLEVAQKPSSVWMLDAFVSQRDLDQLIHRCIEVENIQFAIFHGLSNNRFKRLDISDARELLGYDPQDDLVAENPEFLKLGLSDHVQAHNQSDSGQKSGIRDDV